MDEIPEGYALARDGMIARHQGGWARDKLKFLHQYLDPALKATRKKQGATHYVDLFAGPGRTVSTTDRADPNREFDGSPLIALQAECRFSGEDYPTRFGHFHFCNYSPLDGDLLRRRTENLLRNLKPPIAADRVHFYDGDSNQTVRQIMAVIPTYAYVFTFVDPEGPKDIKFTTLRELRRRHQSVDLYLLYPTYLGFERLLCYREEARRPYEAIFDEFYGTREWRAIVERRRTSRQREVMMQELQALYLRQLRTLWGNAEVLMTVKKRSSRLYHMIFAYEHEAAGSIAQSARRATDGLDLFDGTEDAPGPKGRRR